MHFLAAVLTQGVDLSLYSDIQQQCQATLGANLLYSKASRRDKQVSLLSRALRFQTMTITIHVELNNNSPIICLLNKNTPPF